MVAMEQARMVRDGEVSPAELVDEAIERIERLNPEINAVIHERFERAREEAAGELPDGPFRGVPLLLKVLHAFQKGEAIHAGMAFLKRIDYRAPHDTVVVERYRAAGFVFVGRTNTPELGILPTTEPVAYGPTHNPWDVERSPGGSSGGAAPAAGPGGGGGAS